MRIKNIAAVALLALSFAASTPTTIVRADPADTTIASHPHDAVAVSKGDGNWVRSEPTRKVPVILKLEDGTRLTVTAWTKGEGQKDGWFKVILQDGTNGWIAGQCVRLLN